MEDILKNAIWSFELTFILIKKDYTKNTFVFPKSNSTISNENNIYQFLQFVLKEITRYSAFINEDHNSVESFKIASYLSLLTQIDIPPTEKIYAIICEINKKLNNLNTKKVD